MCMPCVCIVLFFNALSVLMLTLSYHVFSDFTQYLVDKVITRIPRFIYFTWKIILSCEICNLWCIQLVVCSSRNWSLICCCLNGWYWLLSQRVAITTGCYDNVLLWQLVSVTMLNFLLTCVAWQSDGSAPALAGVNVCK